MNCNFKKHIINIIKKYEEQLLYLFYGVLTTIVNYVTFVLLRIWWGDYWIHLINLITFVVATLFAYVTNKIFVFKNKNWNFRHFVIELAAFFTSRVSSFLIEAIGLYICVDILNVGRYTFILFDGTMAAKVVLSFVAVIINYFLSKFVVFRKKKGDHKR